MAKDRWRDGGREERRAELQRSKQKGYEEGKRRTMRAWDSYAVVMLEEYFTVEVSCELEKKDQRQTKKPAK
jgi:hypothetical protein